MLPVHREPIGMKKPVERERGMRSVSARNVASSGGSASRCQPACGSVWIPWLAAPLFAFLPLAGCWLAGYLHASGSRTAHQQSAERSIPTIPMASLVGITPGR
jgi:hypothetical protein